MKLTLLPLIFFLGLSAALAEEEPLSIAAILPLTGNGSDQGEWARRGIDIAVQELKENQGAAVSVVYEDSKGADPATAVQAYKSIAVRTKIAAVITYGSGVAMALSPIVNSEKIIQMGVATGTPKYTSKGDYTFRDFPSAIIEADFISTKLLNDLHAKEIAVINSNSDYGIGTSGAIKSAFQKAGGKVLAEESYQPTETDFRPQLLRLRNAGVSTVVLASYPTDGALILKQAKELGLKAQFVASAAVIGSKDFFILAGAAADGLLVASTLGDEKSKFVSLYNQKYPNESAAQLAYAARGYDGVMLLYHAASICKSTNTECLRDQLLQTKNYQAASGLIKFDENGDIDAKFGLFRVAGKGFVRAD